MIKITVVVIASLFVFSVAHRRPGFPFRPGPGFPSRPQRPNPFASKCESGQFLTKRDIFEIKAKLSTLILEDKIAHVVRIVFHDCVDGCDGCININNPDNAGPMLETLGKLNQMYDANNYDKLLTRADFYALAGIYAIEVGVQNANVGCRGRNCFRLPRIDFEYCRRDCPTSPGTSERLDFPNGHFDHRQVMDFFRNEFGLNPRLATALLGAHTLGGASGASGFLGFWKENATEAAKFDNRYFSLLVDPNLRWNHLDKSPDTGASSPRWQWEGFRDGNQVSFMLNADVALLLDIRTLPSGFSTCTFDSRCSDAPTAKLVRKYAANGNFWLRDFVRAFEIMIRSGNMDRLVRVKGGPK